MRLARIERAATSGPWETLALCTLTQPLAYGLRRRGELQSLPKPLPLRCQRGYIASGAGRYLGRALGESRSAPRATEWRTGLSVRAYSTKVIHLTDPWPFALYRMGGIT